MRIYIQNKTLKTPINLHIPNTFIFNQITTHLLSNALKKGNLQLSEDKLCHLMQETKQCIQNYGHFNFIQIQSHHGDVIEIDF